MRKSSALSWMRHTTRPCAPPTRDLALFLTEDAETHIHNGGDEFVDVNVAIEPEIDISYRVDLFFMTLNKSHRLDRLRIRSQFTCSILLSSNWRK